MDKWIAPYLVTFLCSQCLLRYYLHDCCSWSHYLWHNVHFHTWLTSTFPFPGQDNMRRGTHFHTHHRISRIIYVFLWPHICKLGQNISWFISLMYYLVLWRLQERIQMRSIQHNIYFLNMQNYTTLDIYSCSCSTCIHISPEGTCTVHIVAENDGILSCFMNIVTLNFLYGLFRIKG